MEKIRWGMIGAGDVTEVKSGPAFKKVSDSELIAVMSRNEERAKGYALRHGITHWYTDVDELIANPLVDAVYIATPPHVHLLYAQKALQAGKMVYVEKPVTRNTEEAEQMMGLVRQFDGQLVVAHYRRANPYFMKIKELVTGGFVGKVSLVNLKMFKRKLSEASLSIAKNQWRVDPKLSGGGLFHDLAPHQLDLMISIFGHPVSYTGLSDTKGREEAAVRVAGQMLFPETVLFNGVWDFDKEEEQDLCEIIGSDGTIRFSFFEGSPILLDVKGLRTEFAFEPLAHVQQPMIDKVVQYFLGRRDNPCPIEEGVICMRVMDAFTR